MATTQLEKKHKSGQIAEQIMERIVSGEWPAGSRLPGEVELVDEEAEEEGVDVLFSSLMPLR